MALIQYLALPLSYLLLLCCLSPAVAAPRLSGADGVELVLAAPAQRIVSLAPHLTDTLLALGARAQIVGVVDDHEQAGAHARSQAGLPLVGDAIGLNFEVVLGMRPDLVLAWGSGTPQAWIERLRALGLPVLVLESRRLSDLPREITMLGQVSGHDEAAQQQAEALRLQLSRLGAAGGQGPRLRFFYQAWRQPLYSLNAGHLLSQALALCGADNIIMAGPVAAPLVSPEFVLRENPDILLFSAMDASASQAYWGRFASLRAVRQRQWLGLDDPRLTRPGPGMLSAVQPVCRQIAIWRKRNSIKPR